MSHVLPSKGLQYQPRDLQILRCLLDSRIATIHHLSTLYFDGRIEAARKRIQKLKAAGVVHQRPRRSTDPAIYCLSRKSFRVLQEHGILAEYPNVGWAHLEKRARVSELTLKHELEIMDVRAAMTSALDHAGHKVVEFATWPKLFEFTARQPNGKSVLVKPDGFIRIQGQDATGTFEDIFFLEVDRSTEDLQTLATRAACYRNFYERGGLASRFGMPRSDYKQFPFVVLMIFKTAERRNNIAERLLLSNPPIRNQVWLTTLTEVTAEPLSGIWIKPSDYSKFTHERSTAWTNGSVGAIYHRQTERDDFIQTYVIKHKLLNSTVC